MSQPQFAMSQPQFDLTVYTAGYQGRRPADLLACTQSLGAGVVDIRLAPFSKQPGWSKPELQTLLGSAYTHVPALGNVNYKNGLDIRIADLALGLKILLAPRRRESGQPAILLCGCQSEDACHRSVVAAALRDQGVRTEVLDWEAAAIAEPAELAPLVLPSTVLHELRGTLTRLHDRVIRLRCEDPPKASRAQAFAYLEAQTGWLASQSTEAGGTERGWPDPEDVFAAGDQVDGLREALAELTRPDAPYPVPLPAGCWLLPTANFDVFAAGRLYNGKVTDNGTLPRVGASEREIRA